MKKQLVIIGDSEFAEMACEYFTLDSEYEVIGFAVNKQYHTKDTLFDKSVVYVEELEAKFPPNQVTLFVAILEQQLNRVRTRLYKNLKVRGYSFASYVSSRAFVWHNVQIGENTFIFEDNTLQYNVRIGNNVVLWSGNHIGHRTQIGDNCFITSHVVISGFCDIGRYAYVGVNATFGHQVSIPDDTIVGAGAVIVKSIKEKGGVYVGNPARRLDKSSYQTFGVEE